MEVRCCCDAGKLLGHLPEPHPSARKMKFFAGEEVLEFEVDIVSSPPTFRGHLAYKSKDYPMEKLRKIREFVEAK